MLDTQDLLSLNRWCLGRGLHWQPARTEGGLPAILLNRRTARVAWSGMLLVQDEDGFTLLQCAGDVLATASDLFALLDALDAGVSPAYVPAVSSALWNSLGSAIT